MGVMHGPRYLRQQAGEDAALPEGGYHGEYIADIAAEAVAELGLDGPAPSVTRKLGKTIRYTKPVGTHPTMSRMILRRAEESAGLGDEEARQAGLIIIGHGSHLNAESSAPVYRHAEMIRRTVWAYVTVWMTAYACFLVYPTVAPRPDNVPGVGFAGLISPAVALKVFKLSRDADVVHLHFARDFVQVAAVTLSRGAPLVLQAHGMIRPDRRASRVAPVRTRR